MRPLSSKTLGGEADAVRYGLLALGLLAVIALLPRLIGRLRGSFAWIEVGDLKQRLDRNEAMTVIDVRGSDEFDGPLRHIASHATFPSPNSTAGSRSPPDLNKSRSFLSVGPTSDRRAPRGRCGQPDSLGSRCCGAGWRHGLRLACRLQITVPMRRRDGSRSCSSSTTRLTARSPTCFPPRGHASVCRLVVSGRSRTKGKALPSTSKR